MLGLSQISMVECPLCKRGWSINSQEVKFLNKDRINLNSKTKCEWCNNEFSYIDGIIQSMLSENFFSKKQFVSDIIDGGECEIIVGQTHKFKFNLDIPLVTEFNVTCQSGFDYVKPIPLNEKEFMIMSSQVQNGVPLGEKLVIFWSVSGRTGWDNVPIWQRYLVQAMEQLLGKSYNLALLTCEMAFESYIDTILNNLLTSKGVPSEASHTILESMNNIFTKVHKLLLHLDGVQFKDYKEINTRWQNLVEKRNKVAHGEVAEITETEAKDSFETVVRGILYIYLNTSI